VPASTSADSFLSYPVNDRRPSARCISYISWESLLGVQSSSSARPHGLPVSRRNDDATEDAARLRGGNARERYDLGCFSGFDRGSWLHRFLVGRISTDTSKETK
jgi:hypothetical protein